MAGHTAGGAGGTLWELIWPVPAKTGTYTAGDCVQWNATGAYYAKQTTRAAGGKVVVESCTIATDKNPLSVVWSGPAKCKFDAVCEMGVPVWPSDATAGQVEQWVVGSITTGTAVGTTQTKEIKAIATALTHIMGSTMEEVLGTTTYYMLYVGGVL